MGTVVNYADQTKRPSNVLTLISNYHDWSRGREEGHTLGSRGRLSRKALQTHLVRHASDTLPGLMARARTSLFSCLLLEYRLLTCQQQDLDALYLSYLSSVEQWARTLEAIVSIQAFNVAINHFLSSKDILSLRLDQLQHQDTCEASLSGMLLSLSTHDPSGLSAFADRFQTARDQMMHIKNRIQITYNTHVQTLVVVPTKMPVGTVNKNTIIINTGTLSTTSPPITDAQRDKRARMKALQQNVKKKLMATCMKQKKPDILNQLPPQSKEHLSPKDTKVQLCESIVAHSLESEAVNPNSDDTSGSSTTATNTTTNTNTNTNNNQGQQETPVPYPENTDKPDDVKIVNVVVKARERRPRKSKHDDTPTADEVGPSPYFTIY